MLVSLRRFVDVLIDGDMRADRGTERVVLDMNVINAMGASPFADTVEGHLIAAQKYRELP